MLKPLPIGIQDFRKLIEGGYLYVDKTRWIYVLNKSLDRRRAQGTLIGNRLSSLLILPNVKNIRYNLQHKKSQPL